MKKFITYLFIGAFLLHTASRMLVYFNYLMNQEFIAQNLCENRATPELECHGMCHLDKELSKDDERKQKDQKQQAEMHLFVKDVELKIMEEKIFCELENTKQFTYYNHQLPKGIANSIFHPPTV